MLMHGKAITWSSRSGSVHEFLLLSKNVLVPEVFIIIRIYQLQKNAEPFILRSKER